MKEGGDMDNHNPRTKGLLNILALSMWTPLWLAIALVLALAGGVNLFLGQVGAFAFVELGIGLLMLVVFLLWKRRVLAYIDDSARDR